MVDWLAWRAKGEPVVGLAYRKGDVFVSDLMFPCIDPLTGTEPTFQLWCETGGTVLVPAGGLIRNNSSRPSRRRRNSCCRLALVLLGFFCIIFIPRVCRRACRSVMGQLPSGQGDLKTNYQYFPSYCSCGMTWPPRPPESVQESLESCAV